MHLYLRPALVFVVTLAAAVALGWLEQRSGHIPSKGAEVSRHSSLEARDADRAYQYCLQHIADGCQP